jgi:hypothetical protein
VEAEHSVTLQRVEACSSEEAFERRGTELDADDLCEMTVADLRDSFGRFIKVHCSVGSVSSGMAPQQLHSTFAEMMAAQQRAKQAEQPSKLPTAPSGDRFDFRLQRALILQLEQERLGFPSTDCNVSGANLIRQLAEALQYLLPFDDAVPSPLCAAGRVHLVLPLRFKSEVGTPDLYPSLLLSTLSFCDPSLLLSTLSLCDPSLFARTQTLGEHSSENHHGAKPTLERLSATSLQTHAKKLTQFIGGPRWSERSEWQPFMTDLSTLTEGMERLAAAMAKNAAAVDAARQRLDCARDPDREEDLDGSGYKLRCSSSECHAKYKMLRACVCLIRSHECLS